MGFALCEFFAGKRERAEGLLPSMIFHLGRYNFHLHHWIIGLAVMIILFYNKYYNVFVHGFLVGVIVQGMTYHDFYNVITKTRELGVGIWGITYNFRSHSKTHHFKRKKK